MERCREPFRTLWGVTLVGIDSVMAPQHLRHAASYQIAEFLDRKALLSIAQEIELSDVFDAADELLADLIRGHLIVRANKAAGKLRLTASHCLTTLDDRSNANIMNATAAPQTKSKSRNETRARIIHVGTEILSEKGLVGTGLEEILERVGVPKGSFYYYFESKAKFGFAVLDNYEYLWAQKLTKLLRDPSVAPLDRIDNYISEAARDLEKYDFRRGCVIGNIGQEMVSLDEEFRLRILKVLESWADFIGDCLQEAKDVGDLPAGFNVAEMSKFFWSAWEGVILDAKVARSLDPVNRFRSVLFKYILVKK